MPKKSKAKARLWPHERDLLASGALRDVTHRGASSVWLSGASGEAAAGRTKVYRHMGDAELRHLLETGLLPSTQPYQTIVEGPRGREYAEKYLRGRKKVDTRPTTVVEFDVPRALVRRLFDMQHKAEDGCLSMGLGDKAGNGLPLFNASLARDGRAAWRVVTVKRPLE